MSLLIVMHNLEVERTHPLLYAAPVHNRSGLQEAQLTAKALTLGLEVHHRRLATHDLVDGIGGGGEY